MKIQRFWLGSSKQRKLILSVVIVLVPLCSILTILLSQYANAYCFDVFFPEIADVEKKSYLNFPQSATQIRYALEQQNRTCYIGITFQFDRSELASLLSTTIVRTVDVQSEEPVDDRVIKWFEEKRWQYPQMALTGFTSQSGINGYILQWLVLDDSNESSFTAYLITFKFLM